MEVLSFFTGDPEHACWMDRCSWSPLSCIFVLSLYSVAAVGEETKPKVAFVTVVYYAHLGLGRP